MDQNFPIDIQLKKMTNWMENRRLCGKNWHAQVTEIRAKIAAAIQDMPEHPTIKDLLSATNINYYNCQAILEVLLETEKDSKNMLGMYTSTRISDWRQICSLYEKDSCYLPEASNYLVQAVSYEIPSLKKQMAKQEKNVNDLDKVEEGTKRKISELFASRKADCAKMGIAGDAPKKEILEIVENLPSQYDQWVNKNKSKLKPLMQKYIEAASIHRNTNTCLPTLTFLMDKGNVTAYEYIHGEAPLTIEEPQLINDTDDNDEPMANADIDLEIDLDLDVDSANNEEPIEINWGDDLEVGNDNVDWSIDDVSEDLSNQIVIEESGTLGGKATGQEAFSLLDNKRLRNLVLDELSELSTFCQLKSIEGSQQNKSFIFNDSLNNDENPEAWKSLCIDIKSIIDSLNSGQLHLLHQVKTSSTFVNRFVSELDHKLRMISRLESKIEDVKERRQACLVEAQQLGKSCQKVTEKTKLLQSHLERDISQRYNKRKVNILGGIQSLQ